MRFRALALTLVLPCFVSLLGAQSYQGGLRGSVKDPAAVAVAKITIQDEATNVSRSILSNDQGEFVFQVSIPSPTSSSSRAPVSPVLRKPASSLPRKPSSPSISN